MQSKDLDRPVALPDVNPTQNLTNNEAHRYQQSITEVVWAQPITELADSAFVVFCCPMVVERGGGHLHVRTLLLLHEPSSVQALGGLRRNEVLRGVGITIAFGRGRPTNLQLSKCNT